MAVGMASAAEQSLHCAFKAARLQTASRNSIGFNAYDRRAFRRGRGMARYCRARFFVSG